jgi:hypothetical protein
MQFRNQEIERLEYVVQLTVHRFGRQFRILQSSLPSDYMWTVAPTARAHNNDELLQCLEPEHIVLGKVENAV